MYRVGQKGRKLRSTVMIALLTILLIAAYALNKESINTKFVTYLYPNYYNYGDEYIWDKEFCEMKVGSIIDGRMIISGDGYHFGYGLEIAPFPNGHIQTYFHSNKSRSGFQKFIRESNNASIFSPFTISMKCLARIEKTGNNTAKIKRYNCAYVFIDREDVIEKYRKNGDILRESLAADCE